MSPESVPHISHAFSDGEWAPLVDGNCGSPPSRIASEPALVRPLLSVAVVRGRMDAHVSDNRLPFDLTKTAADTKFEDDRRMTNEAS
jgi:hypothetical protein